MKTIDKIVKFIFMLGFYLVLSFQGVILYVLATLLLIYKSIRKEADFMKEFNDMNKKFIDSITNYIKQGSK